jgi:hypothetical protein
MRTFVLMVAAAALAGSALGETAGPTSTYFEEAKITVNSRAHADGFMRVRIIPQNGTALEAMFPIEKRMHENELARGIADSLNAVLGPHYEADKDGGEHVKIRKNKRDVANFSVEITFNAPGFSVILDN